MPRLLFKWFAVLSLVVFLVIVERTLVLLAHGLMPVTSIPWLGIVALAPLLIYLRRERWREAVRWRSVRGGLMVVSLVVFAATMVGNGASTPNEPWLQDYYHDDPATFSGRLFLGYGELVYRNPYVPEAFVVSHPAWMLRRGKPDFAVSGLITISHGSMGYMFLGPIPFFEIRIGLFGVMLLAAPGAILCLRNFVLRLRRWQAFQIWYEAAFAPG